jgi:hypothetical protein
MRKILLSLLLLCATFAFAAPNPADYNITVHVTASSRNWTVGTYSQHLDVIINGRKYQLQGNAVGVLAPGDYKAKLKETRLNSYDIDQTYEFLLPDGKTRYYVLSGILE